MPHIDPAQAIAIKNVLRRHQVAYRLARIHPLDPLFDGMRQCGRISAAAEDNIESVLYRHRIRKINTRCDCLINAHVRRVTHHSDNLVALIVPRRNQLPGVFVGNSFVQHQRLSDRVGIRPIPAAHALVNQCELRAPLGLGYRPHSSEHQGNTQSGEVLRARPQRNGPAADSAAPKTSYTTGLQK